MSTFDLAQELRAATPLASPELRERVRAIGEPQAAAPRRLPQVSLRGAALVLAPACLVAVAGSALVYGLLSSGSPTRKQPWAGATVAAETHAAAGGAVQQGAFGRLTTPKREAGLAPKAQLPPSPFRLQQYGASLRLRVHDLDSLSTATKTAMRVTRGLGGYVASASYDEPGGPRGESDLVLRIPVGRVQEAITRFSQLGTIVAQHVSVVDLQNSVNVATARIRARRQEIGSIQTTLRTKVLTVDQRARLEDRLSSSRQALAYLFDQRSSTLQRGRLARVSLALTTQQTVAKQHQPGRLGRALHGAGRILTREAAIALYVLVVAGPLLLLALAAVAVSRAGRRRGATRLLERS